MDLALPVLPLLRAFLKRPPVSHARDMAISTATREWLNPEWLAQADEASLRGRLLPFYECVVDPPLHCDTVTRRVRFLRHGLNHILNGTDPVGTRLDRCVLPNGPYFQPGFGLQFWSAVLQATEPDRYPGWTPHSRLAMTRLNLWKRSNRDTPGQQYNRLLVLTDELRREEPTLTGLTMDAFLTAIATLQGREFSPQPKSATQLLEDLARTVRTKYPLRERLKAHRQSISAIRAQIEAGLQTDNTNLIRTALSEAEVPNASIHDDALMDCVRALWQTDFPDDVLAAMWSSGPLLGIGLSFPVGILHLKDADHFPPWDDVTRQGLALWDEGFQPMGPPTEGYRLYREACDELQRRFRLHPLEVPDLFRMATQPVDGYRRSGPNFAGFCADTFQFLHELAQHNHRDWMALHRDRYHFAVREPLAELCTAIACRYVQPLLNIPYGWELETDARTGKALSSITRNDHGQTHPYETTQWITFYRRSQHAKRDDVQLFVRLDSTGLACGLKLGRRAREAGKRFRANIQKHAELLFQRMHTTNAFTACRFEADVGQPISIEAPMDLRRWATGKNLTAERHWPNDHPLLRSDDLVGEIMLTFHQLLPAYRCGVDDAPQEWLAQPATRYTPADFFQQTLLETSWLETAMSLLGMKRQLVLQGVPGTGKTHVAQQLAKLLVQGDDSRVRLVQFHPGYTYEEFVEGVNRGNDSTVSDGVLCEFARMATSRPNEPFVLVIDEMNRGQLARIFGELLYLLEYREHEITLPYSRRAFRLPPNLYLIGTMNAADQSVVAIDQALRRRFSFIEMQPNRQILEHWLNEHPPKEPAIAAATVNLFESLNRQLREDCGPDRQVGQSYFMIPELDTPQLRRVWEHHIRPLLAEYLGHQPQRLARYELERLLNRTHPT